VVHTSSPDYAPSSPKEHDLSPPTSLSAVSSAPRDMQGLLRRLADATGTRTNERTPAFLRPPRGHTRVMHDRQVSLAACILVIVLFVPPGNFPLATHHACMLVSCGSVHHLLVAAGDDSQSLKSSCFLQLDMPASAGTRCEGRPVFLSPSSLLQFPIPHSDSWCEVLSLLFCYKYTICMHCHQTSVLLCRDLRVECFLS
jgi:hypothetical protein